jgi:hypothetical protein
MTEEKRVRAHLRFKESIERYLLKLLGRSDTASFNSTFEDFAESHPDFIEHEARMKMDAEYVKEAEADVRRGRITRKQNRRRPHAKG